MTTPSIQCNAMQFYAIQYNTLQYIKIWIFHHLQVCSRKPPTLSKRRTFETKKSEMIIHVPRLRRLYNDELNDKNVSFPQEFCKYCLKHSIGEQVE